MRHKNFQLFLHGRVASPLAAVNSPDSHDAPRVLTGAPSRRTSIRYFPSSILFGCGVRRAMSLRELSCRPLFSAVLNLCKSA